MGYELRDHTADVAVAAAEDSLEAVFAAVADGLAAASCDEIPDEAGGHERFSLSVTAESREALLFDYLDELIYLRDIRGELPVDHRVETIREPGPAREATEADGDGEPWSLEASARGIPLDSVAAREIKAVTYSEMELERLGTVESETDNSTAEGWHAYVVFDV